MKERTRGKTKNTSESTGPGVKGLFVCDPIISFPRSLNCSVLKALAQNGAEQRDILGSAMVSVSYCQLDRVQNYPGELQAAGHVCSRIILIN